MSSLVSVSSRRCFTPIQALRRTAFSTDVWFCRCPDIKRECPKHNPAPPKDTFCKVEPPEPDPTKRCIYEKLPCQRLHGDDCTCNSCLQCDCEDYFQCSMWDECPNVIQLHDYGCKCSECLCYKDPIGLRKQLSCPKPPLDECRKIARFGERCYCLMQHAKDCQCKQCVQCKFDLFKQELREADAADQKQEMLKLLEKQADKHGDFCKCCQCSGLRKSIQATLCNLHLKTCLAWNLQGFSSRCPECKETLLKMRAAQVNKADDFW